MMTDPVAKMVVLGTAFPGVEEYLGDYFQSLRSQADRNFLTVIVNDGLDHGDILRHAQALPLNIVDNNGSPAENRVAGISHCLKLSADCIVFADCDDVQGPKRIVQARAAATAGHDILFNNIVPMDVSGISRRPLLSPRFRDGGTVGPEDIFHGNCLGLGNTSMRTALLKSLPDFPGNIPAFDWAMFAWLLESGRRAVFCAGADTLYRQHPGNFAGLGEKSLAYLLRCLDVKAGHYTFMADHFPKYAAIANEFKKLNSRAVHSEQFLKELFSKWSFTPGGSRLWWECCTLEGMR